MFMKQASFICHMCIVFLPLRPPVPQNNSLQPFLQQPSPCPGLIPKILALPANATQPVSPFVSVKFARSIEDPR